jgi:site-specific DNA recombinase
MTEKTAIIYARVSVQKDDDDLPIQSQIDGAEKKAAALGARVLRVFVDNGISGRTDKRADFLDAFVYCEIHRPNYFIVWSSSRFARSKALAVMYKGKLLEIGVNLVYVTMDLDTDTIGGFILDGVMELFDEAQARQVSIDTRRSMAKVARDGFWIGGRPPFGYMPVISDKDEKRKKLIPNPDEAVIVREIFDLKSEKKMGSRSIAYSLNHRGYTHRGTSWTKNTICHILGTQAVIGKTVFGRRSKGRKGKKPFSECTIVDSHEPIITAEQWNKVQEQLKFDAHNTDTDRATSHFLFTGLMRCGDCGALCRTESASGRSKRYHYYNCRGAAEQKKHRPRRMPAHSVDQWLIEEIVEKMVSQETLGEILQGFKEASAGWGHQRHETRQKLSIQASAVQEKIDKLYEAIEQPGAGLEIKDIAPRLRQHQAALVKINNSIAELDHTSPYNVDTAKINLETLREALIREMRSQNVRKARAFLKTVISEVLLQEDCFEIRYIPEAMLMGPGFAGCPPTGAISRLARTTVIRLPLPERFKRAA